MRIIERVSAIRRRAGRKAADPKSTTNRGADPQTTEKVRSGLTSSRNPNRHGLPIQEAIGLMSWGALSFAATVFIRIDNPRVILFVWALAIFLITWIVTAMASRTVRLLPVRHRNQTRARHR
jgi:hypothetical protein